MDTRTKIVSPQRALETAVALQASGVPIKAVVGYFDVLLASHVAALTEIADGSAKMIALIGNPPNPLLTQSARVELAAALALVDYVVAVPDDGSHLLRHLQPAGIFHFEEDDLRRTRDLIEHVKQRQKS